MTAALLAGWRGAGGHNSRGALDISTRLGGCTGDLVSCANVPSTSDPKHFLDVVLSLFGPQLLCNRPKIPAGARLMGAAGQKWQFPLRAYMGVRTSARP